MAKLTAIQASFTELTPLCKDMGMVVTDVEYGTATITMPYSEELIGDPSTGVIHGGPVSVLLDSAVFTLLYTVQQQKDRLPSGVLPVLSWKASKAVEEGGFSRKSRGLNRLRPDRRIFQAYPASSSQH